MAKFVEGQSCLLDTTVNVEGKRKRRRTRLSWLSLLLLLSPGAILYISFVNASKLSGCGFFEDLLPAIKIMNPLASLFAALESIEDFGYFYFEPYGNVTSYQHSGLSLTMINVPAWQRVEEILSSEVNVTASMTPCKNTMFSPSKHSAVSHELRLLPHLDVGNYIVYAHSPAFKAYQGVFISAYVSHFLLFFFPALFSFLNNSRSRYSCRESFWFTSSYNWFKKLSKGNLSGLFWLSFLFSLGFVVFSEFWKLPSIQKIFWTSCLLVPVSVSFGW